MNGHSTWLPLVARVWDASAVFRTLVLFAVEHGPVWLGAAMWRHTPVGFALRELFLRDGDLASAAVCSRELRRLGMEA